MSLASWLFSLFGFSGSDRHEGTPAVTLAKGRGYTTDIVGESNYQSAISAIAGPKTETGKSVKTIAQIVFDDCNPHDENAVGILMNGRVVGFLPRALAASFRDDLLRINPLEAPVLCHAKIVGGWITEGGSEGSYGVKLSISNPLRLAP